ncbi:AbrB/MazE/SpoVT family DNA-binding domain-containing protein [Bdellovibrio sp. HCB-162]|uniref:AbrB/MazE/SpoVT family DNA-binding domain-containing protein n=1 Tax=Bdellovibrio sp. HCB-162 TaxID=3394234 RepID=UPI0039BC3AFD
MRKKLAVMGSSMGIVIDKPIIELLKLQNEVELKITDDGKGLVIYPAEEEVKTPRKSLKASLDKVNKKHGKVLKRLR